jgi:ribonuclease P protein component
MLENTRNNFPKKNKLKGVVATQQLFSVAKQKKMFPVKAFYSTTIHANKEVKIGVSAPKKIFKRAVDRNFVKRLLREAVRKNKYILQNQNTCIDKIMLIYIGNTLPNSIELEQKIISLFTELNNETQKIDTQNTQNHEN